MNLCIHCNIIPLYLLQLTSVYTVIYTSLPLSVNLCIYCFVVIISTFFVHKNKFAPETAQNIKTYKTVLESIYSYNQCNFIYYLQLVIPADVYISTASYSRRRLQTIHLSSIIIVIPPPFSFVARQMESR